MSQEIQTPGAQEEDVARQWDRNAPMWAQAIRAGHDIYREYYNQPAMIEFIGDLRGRDVLDAGCGEGYWTRILARTGARMTGVDLSAQMLEFGRQEERRAPLGIRYEVESFTALHRFRDESFDAVVSFMAMMDGPDFPAAMREFFRVLKPGGMLAFSILHPSFTTRGTKWTLDGQGRATALKIGHYFSDRPWVDSWKFSEYPNDSHSGDGWKLWRKLPDRLKLWRKLPDRWKISKSSDSEDPANFCMPRFGRTLAQYINSVIAAGLVLSGVAEPRPSEEACRAYPPLERHRIHAPLFFYLRAVKPSSRVHAASPKDDVYAR